MPLVSNLLIAIMTAPKSQIFSARTSKMFLQNDNQIANLQKQTMLYQNHPFTEADEHSLSDYKATNLLQKTSSNSDEGGEGCCIDNVWMD